MHNWLMIFQGKTTGLKANKPWVLITSIFFF